MQRIQQTSTSSSSTTSSLGVPLGNRTTIAISSPPPPPSWQPTTLIIAQQQQQQQQKQQRKDNNNQFTSLLRIISAAIISVLIFHWYLILHHVNYHYAPNPNHSHDAFLAAFTRKSSRRRRRGGKDGYILSPTCGGCYRTYVKEGKYCYDHIQEYIAKLQQTTHSHRNDTSSLQLLYEASKFVGTNMPECAICNPDTCYNQYYNDNDDGGKSSNDQRSTLNKQQQQQQQTKYWKFDQTSPNIQSPTSVLLPSIPHELRLPSFINNDTIESYIRSKYANNADPANITNVFLMEYNPGLAPIPNKMKQYLPSNAVYVLSLRVTPHNFCFGIWLTEALHDDIKQTMHSVNHLGLALLDANYQIIPDHDVVIDLDRQLGARREHLKTEPAFVDYRLFTLNDELYLHVNSDTVIVTKLRLRSREVMRSKNMDIMTTTVNDPNTIIGPGVVTDDPNIEKILKDFEKDKKSYTLKNLYGGDNLEVTMLHQFNTIWGDNFYGKNYALFALPNDDNGLPDRIYAEQSVYPEHTVQQILPDDINHLPKDKRIKWRQRRNFKIDHIMQRQIKWVGNATKSDRKDKGLLVPSFFNADEQWFPGGKNPFKEFVHGGACCVSFNIKRDMEMITKVKQEQLHLEGVDTVMVGVGHTLVKYYTKNNLPESERVLMPDTNYVSFFYAFDPRPPFDIIVRSGYFCLGFATENDAGPTNPRSILTHNRPLQQNNETFACPQIHYVETIIQKVDDPSTVVIGYGMNDCTARIVEVSKREIASLLFPDPYEMILSDT